MVSIQNNYEKSISQKSYLEGRIQDGENFLIKTEKELSENGIEVKNDISFLKKEYTALSDKLKIIDNELRKIDKLKNEIISFEKDESLLTKKSEEFKDILSLSQKEITSLETDIKNLSLDLKGETDIVLKLDKISNEIENIIKDVNDISNREKSISETDVKNKNDLKNWNKRFIEDTNLLRISEDNVNKELVKRKISSIEDVSEFAIEEKDIKIINNQIKQHDESLLKTQSEIDSLKKRLGESEKPNSDLTETEIKSNDLMFSNIEIKIKDSNNRLNELIRNYDLNVKYEKELLKLRENSKALFELADDLSGKNSRNVNFQSYILTYYLSRVTSYANGRLTFFSDGRYEIKVNNKVNDRRNQAGLDLDVIDTFTGVPRSVKTLSGGEKFMASLSLALGLSDAIQERAGMIEMDSLFLDEGFGTLDDEALNRAISILDDIRENRMIGVISHVSELKKRIPCQIKVIKSVQGSQIQMP